MGGDRACNEPRLETRLFLLFISPVYARPGSPGLLRPGTGELARAERVHGLKNIIFSRSLRNVSLEFHMTHGQKGLNGIWIGKILRMMKFDAGGMRYRGNRSTEGVRVFLAAWFHFGCHRCLSGIPDCCTRISDVIFFLFLFKSGVEIRMNRMGGIIATCGTGLQLEDSSRY